LPLNIQRFSFDDMHEEFLKMFDFHTTTS
jgi:hypothetical protein